MVKVKNVTIIICLALIISLELNVLHILKEISIANEYEYIDRYRDFIFAEGTIGEVKVYSKKNNLDYIDMITCLMIENEFDLSEFNSEMLSKSKLKKTMTVKKNKELYNEIYSLNKAILSDAQCLPIPKSSEDETNYTTYRNSWGESRTYGGERLHEGTDIMASNNLRGYFPVVSMTNGVVEQKGWLEKGGYRIGIRSLSGAYFYYAHLYSYAQDLNVGDSIKAGELLGFMGDTGYSTIEGTTGQFPVHLHLGIYVEYKGEEISVNPYYVLDMLK